MNESILKALMRLFAIVANVNKDDVSSDAREIVKSYLSLQLNKALVQEYLDLFDEYISVHHKKVTDGSKKERKRTSLNSVKVLMICHEINEQLEQKEKIIVLIRLLEFIHEDNVVTEKELDFVKTVADTFNISESEYFDLKYYIIDGIKYIRSEKKLLLINNKKDEKKVLTQPDLPYIHMTDPNIHGEIAILHVESTNTYILKYSGEDSLYMNAMNIKPGRAYVFETGSVIKGGRITPVYYTDVASQYIHDDGSARIVFTAKDIEFRFKNSTNGIQRFSFSEESGNLMGIMGGSGVGKSTLLNVLNGNLPLNSGQITINGYDLHNDREYLEGVIGFVPQDDLLIEELTVYQNLYYNAKLCFSNFDEEEIAQVVEKVLLDLDLIEIKELKVGDPLNKFISGGQRKRLNIALELMREPSVLIVDEPTSGLSSQDSEIVMSLLKEQTLKGKLVLVNIHQPSSDIFKLFDKLLILDKGGFPVYYGNPIDAVVYFKTESNHVNASESECGVCGSVNPEQPLQILEAKVVNEYGRFTRVRKVSPIEWYNKYKEKLQPKIKLPENHEKLPLPQNKFKIPNKFRQFKIFSIRNLLSKLTNKQYLLINFLEAPLLAVILGYFTKYISGTLEDPSKYLFSENENIPAYLFMCVIVALFIGLTVSAEEIIRDRKILKRESFLNLSWASYLNSKIVVLFALAVIQSLSFILVGNFILGIKWMTISYFIVIFSTVAAANLIGLNISSALNSVVTIYITIPFILVPQLLFSGVIVSFNKLHQNFMSVEYVPVIGDLMVSRWAYEALAVNQFKNNNFEKHFYDVEKEISHLSFQSMFRLPDLQSRIDRSIKKLKTNELDGQFNDDMLLIRNEFNRLKSDVPEIQFQAIDQLSKDKFTEKTGAIATKYIEDLTSYYRNKVYFANTKKDEIFNRLIKELGSTEALAKLKEDYYNKRLAEFVLNKNEVKKIVETDHHTLFQVKDPIFMKPVTNNGRAHFYAAEKVLFGKTIDTVWFNIAVIWLSTILLYILLLFNGLKRLVDFLSGLSLFPKAGKKKKADD
jgi:ABC-type multidrug transport system ATPase subunit/recombinational DNA repair protein RecR